MCSFILFLTSPGVRSWDETSLVLANVWIRIKIGRGVVGHRREYKSRIRGRSVIENDCIVPTSSIRMVGHPQIFFTYDRSASKAKGTEPGNRTCGRPTHECREKP